MYGWTPQSVGNGAKADKKGRELCVNSISEISGRNLKGTKENNSGVHDALRHGSNEARNLHRFLDRYTVLFMMFAS